MISQLKIAPASALPTPDAIFSWLIKDFYTKLQCSKSQILDNMLNNSGLAHISVHSWQPQGKVIRENSCSSLLKLVDDTNAENAN